MNEQFITNGIENDRYLKAVRLYKQFEEELCQEIKNVSQELIEQRPDLFVDDATPQKSLSRRRTAPLGHMRMDNDLRRVNDDGKRLTLNIAIEWAQPEIHGHDEPAEGALCIVLYKIKNLPKAEYERVKQETQSQSSWTDIQFDDDVWNSGLGIFYIPVMDGPDVKEGFQTLQAHFLEFGETYGELPSNKSN